MEFETIFKLVYLNISYDLAVICYLMLPMVTKIISIKHKQAY